MIEKNRTDLSGLHCSATFSEDERYRYLLTWRWTPGPLLVAWMLNPSTATHEVLDPTIAGLRRRALAWGLGGVRVINLFAFRATDPKKMKAAIDPIGDQNDAVTEEVLKSAQTNGDLVIAGWGTHGTHLNREAQALAIADRVGTCLHALAVTQAGHPGHPLYVADAIRPKPWPLGRA